MTFETDKKIYLDNLYKPDKSTKGNVDLEISELIDTINGLDDYYTTSSCSGRIILIDVDQKERKKSAKWIFLSHKTVSSLDISEKVKSCDLTKTREVWFSQEPMILHICAKDIESAKKILDVAVKCHFKRSGIFSIKPNRIMIEIIGCDRMDVPVILNGKILASDEYISSIVDIANEKMKKIEMLNDLFLKIILKMNEKENKN